MTLLPISGAQITAAGIQLFDDHRLLCGEGYLYAEA